MKRWWWPYALASLAVALSSWSLWRSYHVPQAPPAVHRFAAAEPASPSWYANARALGRYNVTDPICAGGAVGDDVHDDTAAIIACDGLAKAVNGEVFFPTPSVAYKVTSEIPVNWPGHWLGQGSNPNNTNIRAHAAMRSVVALRSTFGDSEPEDYGSPRAFFSHLTFDANKAANNAVIELGAEFSTFDHVTFKNGLDSCIRESVLQVPASLSAVTPHVGGGSPVGVTMALADPTYVAANGLAAPVNIVVSVDTTGALGTGTYKVSYNGGSTFTINHYTIRATENLVVQTGGGDVGQLSGFVTSFPAGTYHSGDSYTATYTYNNGDYSQPISGNGDITYRSVGLGDCGQVYATSGMLASSSLGGYTHTTVAGTAATTAGSQFIVGTGTSWSTLRGSGSSRGVIVLTGATNTIPFVGILDDQTIAVVPGMEPTATLAGQDYAIALYGGYYEDGQSDVGRGLWESTAAGQMSVCFQYMAGHGPTAIKTSLNSCAVAGAVFGGSPFDSTTSTVLIEWVRGSATPTPYVVTPPSGGAILQASNGLFITGKGTGWVTMTDGRVSGLSIGSARSWLANSTMVMSPSTQTISSAGQQIIAPDQADISYTGKTSYIDILTTGPFLMNASPQFTTIGGSTPEGVVILLRNNSGNTLTFQADSLQTTGLDLFAPFEDFTPGTVAGFISEGGGTGRYRELWPMGSGPYGTGNAAGNYGLGTRRIQTVSSTTPTEIYKVDVLNGAIAPGTVLDFDVSAQSQNGANYGYWHHGVLTWTQGGTRTPLTFDEQIGSGSGNSIPLGWAVSVDPSGTTPFARVYFAGDSSANPVTATIAVTHRDPGQ
jgi:hypothetical protein